MEKANRNKTQLVSASAFGAVNSSLMEMWGPNQEHWMLCCPDADPEP